MVEVFISVESDTTIPRTTLAPKVRTIAERILTAVPSA